MTHGPLSFFARDRGGKPREAPLGVPFAGPSGRLRLPFRPISRRMPPRSRSSARSGSRLRDGLGLATTAGYGPRFLHSTGQFHKGGPNTGLFIQLTGRDGVDISIPGKPYTFGIFKKAQALGDLDALPEARPQGDAHRPRR